MVNPMRPFLFLALLSLLGAPACGGDDDGGEGDGAGDVDGGGGDEDNRFAGHWSTCEFGRRLEFTTPEGTEDDVVQNTGSVDGTDNGDGTFTLNPSDGDFCALDFQLAESGSYGNLLTPQSCTYGDLTLSFSAADFADVSTGDLAVALTISFDGLYNDVEATGNGGSTYHCVR